MVRLLSALVLVVTACSHAANEKHLTAAEHRELATLHEAKADAERQQFDPSQTRDAVVRSPFTDLPDSTMNTYNPTAEHLTAADRELRRAAQHSKEAAKLEAFEDAACQALPKEQRASCPLLASQVSQVTNDRSGVLLTLKDGADASGIEKRLQCHLAWANAVGFDRPTCPLFVKGMSIKLSRANVITLKGDSPEVVRQLQEQARRIFVGESNANTPVSSRN
ncbi:MAG: hypothetical protein IPJ65_31315 [Archangiaceae bacterium]|nr:hypothetical protein [Archangiaceae bacterium]